MTDTRIARLYLWGGLAGILVGGLLALLMRWQWAFPGDPVPGGSLLFPRSDGVITAGTYTRLFTTHGLVMIFFGVTPILLGTLGNGVLPRLVGATGTALPRLGLAALGLFYVALALAALSPFTLLGTGDAGWTNYPPLSTLGTPGAGQTLLTSAILTVALSGVLWSVNILATVIGRRAVAWFDLPLTAWGLFLAAALVALFFPFLIVATLFLLSDRVLGTELLVAGAWASTPGGDPVLYQHLFWLFGHPEVYVLILPAWGTVADLLARYSGKAHPFWRRGLAGSMIAITVLSGLVYGHHMFVVGLRPMFGAVFEVFTLAISAPSAIMLLCWLATLWGGRLELRPPMLYALGSLVAFAYGGLTGVLLGAVTIDGYLHGTLWVVGHFHLTLAAASLLGLFAAVTYWFPVLFGRRLHEGLARAHFWLTAPLLLVVFTGQLWAGYAGQLRRVASPGHYEYVAHLAPLHQATSYAAFLLGAAQLLFVVNVLRSARRGELSPDP